MLNIKIRKAESESDFQAAHALIAELAAFEEAAEEVELPLGEFMEDGKGDLPLYQLFVAEVLKVGETQAQIVGMALCYFIYSTWKGKILYLDDLVVTEAYRKNGIGRLLVDEVMAYAKRYEVRQVRWHVLDWNTPAVEFYKQLGMRLEEEWVTCKFNGQQVMDYKAKKPNS